MQNGRILLPAVACAMLFGLLTLPRSCAAQTISLGLDDPNIIVATGQTVTVHGFVTNTSQSNVYLTDLLPNLSNDLNFDSTPFNQNFVLFDSNSQYVAL